MPVSLGNLFSSLLTCGATKCWDVCFGDQRAKYMRDLPDNLRSLETLSADLSAQRTDILGRVEAAEQLQNKRRLDTVEAWLTQVTTAEEENARLIRNGPGEIQKLCCGGCCGGCCSKNCCSSYKFGKKVAQQIDTINDLIAKTQREDFKPLIGSQPLCHLIPMESPIGLDSTLNRAWGFIQNADVGIIGLHGPGGVGKTTLLTQIHNKFKTDFVVIWVVVSQGCNPEKLQEDIGKIIGFSDDSWKMKSYDEKAKDILRILGRKKFALFLDDIWDWEHVNPTKMGIPSKLNGSKIIFTTRIFEVCGQMQANEKILVDYLKTPEAFKLFREKVGEDTLASDPMIPELAERVVEECAGLPLVLITVAWAMIGKQMPEQWESAIEVLQRNASKFPKMTEKVYSRLKFSYDHLPKMVQSCFLYCCLFPDDFNILKSDLIEYWNCEGFLEEKSEINNRGCGFDIIGTLLNACLLEKHGVGSVKMHDVIREMALWIAQEEEKDEHGFFVRAGSKLREVPQVEEWIGARRVSLMHNNIQQLQWRSQDRPVGEADFPAGGGSSGGVGGDTWNSKQLQEVPSCSNLLTLFLNDNKLKMINSQFFKSMPSLVALDLSKNWTLVELPSEISNLVFLEYLSLSFTGLQEVPIALNALVRLKYLNLEWTKLKHIPCNLISEFPKLQTLKMRQSPHSLISFENTILFFKELQSLEYLNTLTISINSKTAFREFQKSERLQSCTLGVCFLEIKEVIRVSVLLNMKRLESLSMVSCTNIVDDIELDLERVREDNEGMRLQNVVNSTIRGNRFNSLKTVGIQLCHVVDLTWLINAPNLTEIHVINCMGLEEVISMEKLGEGQNLNMFAKLEKLVLHQLPKLKSICKDALSFPCLKELWVLGCKELKKLPVNLNTNKFTIRCKRTWWRSLEWEDEATKTAFTNIWVH